MSDVWVARLVVLAFAAALVPLARGLPPDTFFVGDSGVKLTAARHAAARPERPLELPLPRIEGEPALFLEPFFAVHGDHAHAVTPELFPLLSAPPIAALGSRGAYILPALGFLLFLAAAGWLAVSLDPRRSAAMAVLAAALATPLLFYGLEFWEHAPAVGVAALGTVLVVRSRNGSTRRALPAAAGVLFGAATLLRPEAIWYVLAVFVSARWLEPRPRGRSIGIATIGLAVALLPLVAVTAAHFGSFVTPHLGGNPAIWGAGWLDRRGAIFASWFLSLELSSLWRVAPAAAIGLPPWPRPGLHGRAFLTAAAAVTTALIFLTAPNDGGGQWGPRYLLFAFVPLAVLAGGALQTAGRRGAAGATAVALALVGSAWLQRDAYKELRGAKLTYARMLDFVAREIPAGGYGVTDLWWLDQVAAAATAERQLLFAQHPDAGVEILRRLDAARVARVTVMTDRDGSAGATLWSESTCYREAGRREIPERSLVAIALMRAC